MSTYIAFLRGINVGGNKLIKMDALARIFASAGLKNVRTYIQSGNVIFDAPSANSTTLTEKIERTLHKTLGYEVTVILRTKPEIEDMVRRNPFRRIKSGDDVMLFVVFLSDEPRIKPKLPLISTTENLEVFEIKDRAAFIVARRNKTGRSAFPNNFAEEQFGVVGTTRNWTTVHKMIAAAKAHEEGGVQRKKR